MAKGAYIGAPAPEYKRAFADNTWSQIIKACQKKEVPSTWSVGDQKAMTIGGVEYLVDIIGKNHDDYSDGSGKAPLTFQLHDCLNTEYRMRANSSDYSYWDTTEMYTTHLPAILKQMPSEVQNGIKAVNKLRSYGGGSSSITTFSEKLFLLSEIEVLGAKKQRSYDGEGTQYDYYAGGRSTIKKFNGTANTWWTRSSAHANVTNYVLIAKEELQAVISAPNSALPISFAFCFGGTSEVNNTFGGQSVAHRIKKGYIGVGGVARQIIKAYIGIGGVARPCFSYGELSYYGTVTPLSSAKSHILATSVGNYALFAGGTNAGGSDNAAVDAYDKSLTVTKPNDLLLAQYDGGATTVGNYALFAGGHGSSNSPIVTAYNTSLTRSQPDSLTKYRTGIRAASVGDYALFGGNYSNGTQVDAYNSSLTRTTAPSMYSVSEYAATSNGNYALFGGGTQSFTVKNTVYAYNASLTVTTGKTLSTARRGLSATRLGNYALFAGGNVENVNGTSTYYAKVDAFDGSLTRTTPSALSTARKFMGAASVGKYALFCGGYSYANYATNYYSTVDKYDSSLTRASETSLCIARAYTSGASVGDYALFAGGSGNSRSNVVDCYTIA